MLRKIGMNSNFTVKLKKDDLLGKLRQNRENHIVMVKEAKEGYRKEAERLLKERLKTLKASENLVNLEFSLKVPVDCTEEYDSVIRMFELHQEDEVTLSVNDFDTLYEDKWDWMREFMFTNSRYSSSVAALAQNY